VPLWASTVPVLVNARPKVLVPSPAVLRTMPRVAEQLEPVAAGGEGLIALKIKKPARLVVDRPGVSGGVVCDREGAAAPV